MARVLMYEVPGAGDYITMQALTNSGDNTQYNYTGGGDFLSAFIDSAGTSYAPTVLVDGVISGAVVIPAAAGTNNLVDVSAMAANIGGVAYTGATKLAADTDLTCLRGSALDVCRINSITHTGSAWAVISGTAHTAFDLAGGRGGAGEPPYIPVGSIEVAQVRFSSITDAAVLASEIKMIPGDTKEMAYSPGKDIEYARLDAGTLDYPGVTMRVALPAIHTGDATRGVWLSGYEAAFSEWQKVNDVAFQGESISSTSDETFSGTDTYTSSEVSDGSFSWSCNSITSDPEWAVMEGKDAKVWLKLYETRGATEYLACQAVVSGVPTLSASGPTTVSCTLSGGSKYLRIVG